MLYSVLVLIGLTAVGGTLVAVAGWLVENSEEPSVH